MSASEMPKKIRKGFNSQFKKRRYYSPETRDASLKAFRKNVREGIKKNLGKRMDRVADAHAQTREVYAKEGRLEELEDLVATLRESGVHHTKDVYDKDGNLIPLFEKRPSSVSNKYNKTLARQICSLIAEGNTVSDICKKQKVLKTDTFRKWYRDIPEFRKQVDQAYTERADYYVDKLFELMEEVKTNEVGVREATFVADNIKWIAERLHPRFMQKRNSETLNVQVNDDAKVQFQIMLAGGTPDVPMLTDGAKHEECGDQS